MLVLHRTALGPATFAICLVGALLLGSSPGAGSDVAAARGAGIVVTFDDGCASNLVAARHLEARGARGTFFIVAGTPEGEPDPAMGCTTFLSSSQVRELAARGHDIQSHTMTHPHLVDLDPASVAAELADSQQALRGLTRTPVRHFAYPFGETAPHVREAVARQYASGRLFYRDLAAMPLVATDPYALPAIGVVETTTPDAVRAIVALAASRGITLVIVFHDITWTPGPFDTTPPVFEALLDEAERRSVPLMTMDAAYQAGTLGEGPISGVRASPSS